MNPLKPLLKPYKKLFKKQQKFKNYHPIYAIENDTLDKGVCECVGADGSIKDWYRSESIAYQVAKRFEYEFKIRLNIYHCPSSRGWHLTKL